MSPHGNGLNGHDELQSDKNVSTALKQVMSFLHLFQTLYYYI